MWTCAKCYSENYNNVTECLKCKTPRTYDQTQLPFNHAVEMQNSSEDETKTTQLANTNKKYRFNIGKGMLRGVIVGAVFCFFQSRTIGLESSRGDYSTLIAALVITILIVSIFSWARR